MFSAGCARCGCWKRTTAVLEQGEVLPSGKLFSKGQQTLDTGTLMNVLPEGTTQGLHSRVCQRRDVTSRGPGLFGGESLQRVGKPPDSVACGPKGVGQWTCCPSIQTLDEATQMMQANPAGFIKRNHDGSPFVAIIGDPQPERPTLVPYDDMEAIIRDNRIGLRRQDERCKTIGSIDFRSADQRDDGGECLRCPERRDGPCRDGGINREIGAPTDVQKCADFADELPRQRRRIWQAFDNHGHNPDSGRETPVRNQEGRA